MATDLVENISLLLDVSFMVESWRPLSHSALRITATTLIYAIEAGITAAAGTRLDLQLFLVKGFRLPIARLRQFVVMAHAVS